VATCDLTKLHSIFIYADGNHLEITPASYVLNLDIGMPGKCLMGFTKNSANYWLMGDSFLRNFYTIWDEENDKLGFATHITSTATILTTTGVVPT
jgi:hypothetical protein